MLREKQIILSEDSFNSFIFKTELESIAFNKAKHHLPKEFRGKPTLYENGIKEVSDFYYVNVIINNVKRSEDDYRFVVQISRDDLLAYIVKDLKSRISSVASSTWKEL